jgi:DNA-binding protein YbaB
MTVPPGLGETNAVLKARFEQLASTYERLRSRLADAQERMRAVQGEAADSAAGVRVTVGSRGQLVDLQIEPRAYRRLSPSELAEAIKTLTREAGENAAEEMQRIVGPLLPAGVRYADLAAGRADPTAWTGTGPVTDATFDDWWARFAPVARPEEGEDR